MAHSEGVCADSRWPRALSKKDQCIPELQRSFVCMGQIMVRRSGKVQVGDNQVRVKSQKYSELDIGGHETCYSSGDGLEEL